MTKDIEIRSTPLELRATGRRLEGYCALYGIPGKIGTFTEIIREGAFRTSLQGDILCLMDHDPTRVLGRTRSGTLRLTDDKRGLHFDLDLPETSSGRDALALAERGDLGGMSFGFHCLEDRWQGDCRELVNVALHEVSVVSAHPAYPQTSVTARSRTLAQASIRLSLARRFLETMENSK